MIGEGRALWVVGAVNVPFNKVVRRPDDDNTVVENESHCKVLYFEKLNHNGDI